MFVVDDYCFAMIEGARFPPLVVFYDGQDYWLSDGFHRLQAAKLIELELIDCEIRQGTRRDAILFSVGANSQHGLRRNNADKRRAVETLLSDPEWSRWSDHEIARRCSVSQPFVSKLRSQVPGFAAQPQRPSDNRYQMAGGAPEQKTGADPAAASPSYRLAQRDGTVYSINVTGINAAYSGSQHQATSSKESEPAPELPPSPSREIVKRKPVGPIERPALVLLRDTPVAEQRDEQIKLAKLEPDKQVAVAEQIARGQASSVSEATRILRRQELKQLMLATPELPPSSGDSCLIEQGDSINHIEANSVDLVLVDPPYHISDEKRLTKVGDQVVTAEFDRALAEEDLDPWDRWESQEDYLIKLHLWASEWARVAKPGGAIISFIDRALVSYLWLAFCEAGLVPKNIITWAKTNIAPTGLVRRNLISSTEFLVWAVKPGQPYVFNEVDGWDRRNFILTNIISNTEKVDHPTQKPLAVLRPLIELTTNPGDLVLDPMAGSGSAGVAAVQLGRHAHLVERNQYYVWLAQQRLQAFTNPKSDSTPPWLTSF